MKDKDIWMIARQIAANSFISHSAADEEMNNRGWYYVDKVRGTLNALRALGYKEII